MNKERVYSNAPWEKQVGYCRALKTGNQIYITGTAAVADDGSVYAPNNPYEQARRCIEIIKTALEPFKADLSNVVRTRMFVTNIKLWEDFGKAHKEYFHKCPPATTMVEVKALIHPDMLIEIEADAWVES